MARYIGLLRGINVSGQKLIKMDQLRSSLAKLGFDSVQTYIQSGNIIFTSAEQDQQNLQHAIHQNILETFGYEVPVLVRSKAQWKDTFESNPFVNERNEDISKLYVTILEKEPEQENFESLKEFHKGPEEMIRIGLNLYLLYPNGAGKSKLDHNTIERKLKVRATSRNWKTTTKLMEMLNQ